MSTKHAHKHAAAAPPPKPKRPVLTEAEINEARRSAMQKRVAACGEDVKAVLAKHSCRLVAVPDPEARPQEVAPGVWVSAAKPVLMAEEIAAPANASPV